MWLLRAIIPRVIDLSTLPIRMWGFTDAIGLVDLEIATRIFCWIGPALRIDRIVGSCSVPPVVLRPPAAIRSVGIHTRSRGTNANPRFTVVAPCAGVAVITW